MATDLNKVTMIGRLTKDPEYKTIGQTALASFSLANNRSYTHNGEKKEEVNFFECDVWGKLADVLRDYGKKGKQIAIEGRLQQQTWDGQDGKKMSKIKIRVETFQLLGGPSSSNSSDSDTRSQDVTLDYAVSDISDNEDIF